MLLIQGTGRSGSRRMITESLTFILAARHEEDTHTHTHTHTHTDKAGFINAEME